MKRIHVGYFNTVIDYTSGYVLFFGFIGKGLLWIYQKLFPKKYYIGIFRGITFTFSCLFLFLAAGILFVDWNKLF
ncbi:DNA-binding protein [Bacillus cereus group sp. MYBK163-2]|uniref:DNA-binding protein n=1 Tax=Bacillus TaxID=1386 RepID=UPI00351D9186